MPTPTFLLPREYDNPMTELSKLLAERNKIGIWLGSGACIASIVMCAVVLLFALVIQLRPQLRSSIRRQSFRMMLAVQTVCILWSASVLTLIHIKRPTPWCSASVIVSLFSVNFVNISIMLVAVNLQLVLCHHMRTINFTRYYIAGPFLAASIIVMPSSVKGVWGWDPLLHVCYNTLHSRRQRVEWEIGTLYIWSILCSFVSLASTTFVLLRLFVHSRRIQRNFTPSNLIGERTCNTVRRVAFRIVWYPITLVLSMGLSTTIDIYTTIKINPVTRVSHSFFVLRCLFAFFYCGTPFFCAIVALFVDPSFAIAVRSLFRSSKNSSGCTTRPVEIAITHVKTSSTDSNKRTSSFGTAMEVGSVKAILEDETTCDVVPKSGLGRRASCSEDALREVRGVSDAERFEIKFEPLNFDEL